jgi:protocatechuate 3,4-dioxygenase, beta subunit
MSAERDNLNRRSFIHYASAALVLPFIGFGASCADKSLLAHATSDKASAIPWNIRIDADGEPGQPLIVSGTIFAPDGRTPLEGVRLFVYQTDATGNYSAGGNGDNRNTRLHGEMRTNAEGRYEFHTIRPGSYPGTRNAAHMHAYVSGPGYPEYWIDEYLFDDDPFVTEEVRRKSAVGSFAPILKTTKGADGILRAVRDIKIERCSRTCTGRE